MNLALLHMSLLFCFVYNLTTLSISFKVAISDECVMIASNTEVAFFEDKEMMP